MPKKALIIVDVQNDFLPGGALAVPRGDEVVPVLNCYIAEFEQEGLPIVATRDWHPPNHCSFRTRGGPWPVHCVQHTAGAAFAASLRLPSSTRVISKGTSPEREAYSGFAGTALAGQLRQASVECLYIGGLATDYCVLNTVRDAVHQGFAVKLLSDAIRGVNLKPGDAESAVAEMVRLGAVPLNRGKR